VGSDSDAGRLIEGLRRFLTDVADNRARATQAESGEALHDLRVGVRRSRSLLKNAKGALTGKTRKKFLREFAWLQDVTGPTRDYEVWMASLDADDPLRFVLAGHHDQARDEATAALASKRTTKLIEQWQRVLDDELDVREFDAAERVTRQRRRVRAAAEDAAADAPAERLHRLRKRVKELRYLLDLFGSDDDRPQRKTLKQLQDHLGAVQDVAVQRHWLEAHVEEVGPIDVRLKELDDRDSVARMAYAEDIAGYLASVG
jgi:CHAD domain-containing protein